MAKKEKRKAAKVQKMQHPDYASKVAPGSRARKASHLMLERKRWLC
jgi:hypothetical protein